MVARRPPEIPACLPFTIELTKPIPAAAAGDAFTARLVLALRDSHGKILAPAQAPVEGRLLRVENYLTPPLGAIMVLQPGTIEIRGAQIPVAAKPDPQAISRPTDGQHCAVSPGTPCLFDPLARRPPHPQSRLSHRLVDRRPGRNAEKCPLRGVFRAALFQKIAQHGGLAELHP